MEKQFSIKFYEVFVTASDFPVEVTMSKFDGVSIKVLWLVSDGVSLRGFSTEISASNFALALSGCEEDDVSI